MTPMTFRNGYMGDDSTERIVAIEYHPEGPKKSLVPFSVFTVNHNNPPTDGWISGLYDFDWCKRDQRLYWHCSGGGGRFYLHPMANPNSKPRVAVWWDSALVGPHDGGKSSKRILSLKTVRAWGYDILPEPIQFLGDKLNPFDASCHDSVEYCSRCNDYLPTENLCRHTWWCEKCGRWSTPSERCEHRRERL